MIENDGFQKYQVPNLTSPKNKSRDMLVLEENSADDNTRKSLNANTIAVFNESQKKSEVH